MRQNLFFVVPSAFILYGFLIYYQLLAISSQQLVGTFSFQFSILNFQLVALGIGAASFASESGTGFGDGDEVTELVEVPKSYFDFWSETEIWRAKI